MNSRFKKMWTTIKLILVREVRDQLRDRRTLFMIVVLPILLYPLLGMSFFQISQFVREQPTSVLVVGYEEISNVPSLVENKHFSSSLYSNPNRRRLLELHFARSEPTENGNDPAPHINSEDEARQAVHDGRYDAALFFPNDFAERLARSRQSHAQWVRNVDGRRSKQITKAADSRPLDEETEQETASQATIEQVTTQQATNKQSTVEQASINEGVDDKPTDKAVAASPAASFAFDEVPQPEVIYTTASEKSQIAFARLSGVLRRWCDEIGRENLISGGVPPRAVKPFELATSDMAEESGIVGAAAWAKILPVMLLIWALTGAFYPAIDLCAGEKERGTLETLLCSPAERSEIVCGKLLTVMLFSMVTAVLNILSVGLTGWLVLARVPGFGPPPTSAAIWLLLALIPVAALFSALCIALASLARSSKEGQYYLMPVLLVTMPLVILPMTPSAELNLGTSLIPITNIVLLLRCLLESHYWQAMQFALPVIAVTLTCCLFAIRWAVDQFNQESVLFRESERLSVGLWLRHLRRDRLDTPTVAAAAFCGVLILVVKFFMSCGVSMPKNFGDIANMLVVTQFVVILAPAIFMAIVFTRRPMQTLLLDKASWRASVVLAVPAALLLAVAINPIAVTIQSVVMRLYPIDPSILALDKLLRDAPSFWVLLLLVAILPAICEELAFRGFILSGFRHMGHKWRAIIWSAVLFGLTHSILQQSLLASLVGVVIGFIAIQSGNLLPCIAFHAAHNSLALVSSRITSEFLDRNDWLQAIMQPVEGGFAYSWSAIAMSAAFSVLLLFWFHQLPYEKSEEEEIAEAIRHGCDDFEGSEDLIGNETAEETLAECKT